MEENIQNFRHVPETNAMRLIQLNLLQRSSPINASHLGHVVRFQKYNKCYGGIVIVYLIIY
jgi:hypothetical protein